jgi:hypothetical protein
MVANQHSPKFMAYLLVKGEECGENHCVYGNIPANTDDCSLPRIDRVSLSGWFSFQSGLHTQTFVNVTPWQFLYVGFQNHAVKLSGIAFTTKSPTSSGELQKIWG